MSGEQISRQAWIKAAGDFLIDPIEDAQNSCNVLLLKGDELGVVRVTEDQAREAQAELDRKRVPSDAMIEALRIAMEREQYASYEFSWCSKSERDEILRRLCSAVLNAEVQS
jgi:hypothetical protein